MTRTHQLGELQLAIMRILWARGEATVAQVHQALEAERGLALTTIATMLSKMEKKGIVTHRSEGRLFVFQPEVSEEDVHCSMVAELTDRLFEGRASLLVSHLLSTQEIDPKEVAEIRRLIERHSRAEGKR